VEQEDLELALNQYTDNIKLMAARAEVEYEGNCSIYPQWKKSGLSHARWDMNNWEWRVASDWRLKPVLLPAIVRAIGYEVYSVICKVAGIAKSSIGIPKEREKIGAAMCNHVIQARFLNLARTELIVVIGLGVGQDSFFYKYSKAYTTTLVAKDRVTGHNPAAARYTANSYYRKKLMPEGEQSR
jgi:Uncharacterized metal-binding protein conserved in archaea